MVNFLEDLIKRTNLRNFEYMQNIWFINFFFFLKFNFREPPVAFSLIFKSN